MSGIESGWGLDFVLWLQSMRGPLLDLFAQAFQWLGSEDFFMLLVPFIYWAVDVRLGRRMFLMLVASIWVNGALKLSFQRPRPFEAYPDQVENVVGETSPYGIPSGHAQTATALAAPLAYHVKRGWFTALMVAYVVLMMISRIIGGAHFPQDVVVGVLVGLVLFAAYIYVEGRAIKQLRQLGMWAEIGAILLIGAVMYAIHPGLLNGQGGPSDPLEVIESSVAAIGVFIGGGVGFMLESRYVRFNASGAAWKRVARFVIGVVVVLGLRFGLSAVFGDAEPVQLFRLIRYIVIGLWAAYGAPWVFVKTGLAGLRPASEE